MLHYRQRCALSEIAISEGAWSEAERLLEPLLGSSEAASVHARLADVHMQCKRFIEALAHYHQVMPTCLCYIRCLRRTHATTCKRSLCYIQKYGPASLPPEVLKCITQHNELPLLNRLQL